MKPVSYAPLSSALILVCLATCANAQPADIVLKNSRVYTVDAQSSWAEAVAIRDGELVFVGDEEGARAFVGDDTRLFDLEGRMMMPGVHDSHMHLLEAFHAGFTCPLAPDQPPESYIPRLQICKFFQLGTDWVIGFGHTFTSMLIHLRAGGRPPVEILDEAIPNRPAVILEATSHSVWANSLALAAAGFDKNAPNPPGGVILKDPTTGKPNGLLLDGAGEVVMDLAFAPNPEMDELNDDALERGLNAARKQGITSIADARAYWRRGYVEAYRRAATADALTARVVLGLWAYPYLDDTQQIAELSALYDDDPNSLLRASQIKIYSDGEVSHSTAALLEPYQSYTFASPLGLTYFDSDRLTRYITELERVGFNFHIHTIGDRGVQQALDAIESSRQVNGDLGRRHRLTHLEVVAPEDISRFVELDVTADVQTSSDFVLPKNDGFYDFYLGRERAEERVLPLRDLYEAGARVVLSSDYDVGDLSPFKGMERALNRGDQSLPTVDAAIRAYTINAAYLFGHETRVGSLEVGKQADLIVLDRNIVEQPGTVGETEVLLTVVGGKVVYRDPGMSSGKSPGKSSSEI